MAEEAGGLCCRTERKMLYTNSLHLKAGVTYLLLFIGMLKKHYESKTKKTTFYAGQVVYNLTV